MLEWRVLRSSTVNRVYLIVALFVAIIFCFLFLMQFLMDVSVALRAYVGGEALWARAQREAVHRLEHYAESRNEADYQAYLRAIQVPLGDQKARMELQKPKPNLDIVREGYLQGGNHPADIEYAIPFFGRFQHNAYISRLLAHWIEGDRLIAELRVQADALHREITSGRASPESIRSIDERLDAIGLALTKEEALFSDTLAEASRWADGASRKLAYATAVLFAALGVLMSLPIITRIRATEGALFDSEQKFRSITNSAWDAIVMIDQEGKTVFFNQAAEKMFGYPSEEIAGKDMHALLAPARYMDDYRRAYPHFARTGEGATIGRVLEMAALRKDGAEFPIELSVSAIQIEGKWHSIGIIRDITGRKQAEEETRRYATLLEHRNRELQRFAQVASHDLQEPLRMISSYLQMIERRYKGRLDKDADEFIGFAVGGAKRLQELIVGISEYYQVMTRAKPFQATDFEAVLARVLGNLEHAIRDSGAVITHDPLPMVMADGDQLAHLFFNLLENAIVYRKPDEPPRIHISAEQLDGEWKFAVRDNGIGFEPHYVERIFGIFQRLHAVGEYPGTGIGLAICKRIVEDLGGKIWAESEPGKGSIFHFTIPAAMAAQPLPS